jgi:hypothetical protein
MKLSGLGPQSSIELEAKPGHPSQLIHRLFDVFQRDFLKGMFLDPLIMISVSMEYAYELIPCPGDARAFATE